MLIKSVIRTIQSLLRIILDTFFPPTAHGKLLAGVTPEIFLRHYQVGRVGSTVTLSQYHSPRVQAAIAACKFERNTNAAKLLSTLIEHWLSKNPTAKNTVIIPTPLSYEREKKRGFNQVTRVLSYICTDSTIKIENNWLLRTKNTERQTSLGRTARLHNIDDAFTTTDQLQKQDWSNISRVIICDDVITTGATLAAARNAIEEALPAGIELICLAWAH